MLLSAKLNNFEAFLMLIEFPQCNIYTICYNLKNPLHYAVANESEKMIKVLISVDAESEQLVHEKD